MSKYEKGAIGNLNVTFFRLKTTSVNIRSQSIHCPFVDGRKIQNKLQIMFFSHFVLFELIGLILL